jgi:L-alanine-DL-glutamate epimerase-like enolase superfamily enzyme
MHLSLHRTTLTYGGGLTLHTAASGKVAGLATLYLSLVDADGIEAAGEVRVNIAYLNGLPADTVVAEALDLVPRLDLAGDPAELLADPPSELAAASAPIRMLVDMALHDRAAKRRGMTLAALLGGGDNGAAVSHPTNQTLFVSDDATLLRQAEAYVARGFRDLKLRIGVGEFADDLRRVRLLRDRFGRDVTLAADANGAWPLDAARGHLDALAPLGLDYVEQPVAPAPFETLARLAEQSPLPIMLDESVKGEDDIAALAAGGHRLMAHLKLVKLGGLAPARRAARALSAAGVPYMIGQMNEGGLATAAALHLSAAVRPRFAELYGADGIENDAAPGLHYRDGSVTAPPAFGLGLAFRRERTRTLWEN